MADGNLAYDFDRFDRESRSREKQQKKAQETRYRVVRGATQTDLDGADILLAAPNEEKKQVQQHRKTSIVRVAATCIALLMMFGIVIYNQARLNEINSRIAKTSRQISRLQSEYQTKRVELDRQLSLKSAQEIAENELGMTETDGTQITYVTLDHSAANEPKRSGDGLLDNAGRFLEDAYAYLSGN